MMRKAFLAVSCLALVLLGALVIGTGLGLAEGDLAAAQRRPTATPDRVFPPSDTNSSDTNSPDVPSMPDLVVESIKVSPASPVISEPVMIEVTIRNIGLVDVSLGPPPNNFLTDLYLDPGSEPIELFQRGIETWDCQAWWVPQNGTWTLRYFTNFYEVKSYALWAQVDTDDHVNESNPYNNVIGPIHLEVRAPHILMHETHQDFQMGLASSLDVTHPDGVLRRGVWLEPDDEPEVYRPDVMINDISGTVDTNGDVISTKAFQVRPALASDGQGTLFSVWEDSRNGYYYRDIYFSRSDDDGLTWGADVTVTENITGIQSHPALAYDQEAGTGGQGRLYVAWQDGRAGDDDYDIYFAYSDDLGDTWEGYQKLVDSYSQGHQLRPSIAIEPPRLTDPDPDPRKVYVVWQDQRNENDDVYLARSNDEGETWYQAPFTETVNYFVTDDAESTLQDQRSPSIGVDSFYSPTLGIDRIVFVCWEDWRWPQKSPTAGYGPEIYCAHSYDHGETFGIDVPVELPAGESHRTEPTMVVTTSVEISEEWDPEEEVTKTESVTVTALHAAWTQGQANDADIYYGYATHNYKKPKFCPYPYDFFCFDPPVEISGFVMDSYYALAPDTGPTWPVSGTWQGEASIVLAPMYDQTNCHADTTTVYSNGVYIAWSDARSYDDWRYELRTRRVASKEKLPEKFEPCEDWAVGVVNNDTKIYAYRDDLDEYDILRPAATRQRNPSLAIRPSLVPFVAPTLYLAWDDDRWDEPLASGQVRNRDIFFAKTGMKDEAIYISPVIDGGKPDAIWYVLSWWGVTQNRGDLLMQTRFGDDPYPPQDNITTTGWTVWTGNPSSPYLGCEAGEGCFYDAPWRPMVDPDGNERPVHRYMQYKVIIRDYSVFTALSRVVIHYEGIYRIYVPTVFRSQ